MLILKLDNCSTTYLAQEACNRLQHNAWLWYFDELVKNYLVNMISKSWSRWSLNIVKILWDGNHFMLSIILNNSILRIIFNIKIHPPPPKKKKKIRVKIFDSGCDLWNKFVIFTKLNYGNFLRKQGSVKTIFSQSLEKFQGKLATIQLSKTNRRRLFPPLDFGMPFNLLLFFLISFMPASTLIVSSSNRTP